MAKAMIEPVENSTPHEHAVSSWPLSSDSPIEGRKDRRTMTSQPTQERKLTRRERETENGHTSSTGSDDEIERERGMILAVVKTNIKVQDESSVVKQLSYLIAAQFASDNPIIVIELNHGLCLAMDSSLKPCYTLTLTLSKLHGKDGSGGQPNGSFIQMFTSNVLGIPQHRGMLLYQNADVGRHTADTATPTREPPRTTRIQSAQSFSNLRGASAASRRVMQARTASLARLNGDDAPIKSSVRKDEAVFDDSDSLRGYPESAKRETDGVDRAARNATGRIDTAGDGIARAITNDRRSAMRQRDLQDEAFAAGGWDRELHRTSTKVRSTSVSRNRSNGSRSLTALPTAEGANGYLVSSPGTDHGRKDIDNAVPSVEHQMPQVPPDPEEVEPVPRKLGRRKSFVKAFKLATAAD